MPVLKTDNNGDFSDDLILQQLQTETFLEQFQFNLLKMHGTTVQIFIIIIVSIFNLFTILTHNNNTKLIKSGYLPTQGTIKNKTSVSSGVDVNARRLFLSARNKVRLLERGG